MTKSFTQFTKGDYGLIEAKASETHLQYLRAKTHRNDHFETRRYIADKILGDKKLADAYSSLEKLHKDFGSVIGNDAITIRQRLEKTIKDQLRKKVINWDNVWSEL